jgi:hypothetical protein
LQFRSLFDIKWNWLEKVRTCVIFKNREEMSDKKEGMFNWEFLKVLILANLCKRKNLSVFFCECKIFEV